MTCIRFEPGFAAQAQALAALLRPHEIRDQVPTARALARQLGFANGVASWLQIAFALGTLRHLPDPEGRFDYWCSPATTRFRRGGDCDDLSILVTSLLRAGGVHAWVVIGGVATQEGLANHAWVEGVDELGGFFIEATTGKLLRTYRPLGYREVARVRPEYVELAA